MNCPKEVAHKMSAKGWIEVSNTYYKGCELCISACLQEVMELAKIGLTPKGYHPTHTFKDGSKRCVICTLVFPGADMRAMLRLSSLA